MNSIDVLNNPAAPVSPPEVVMIVVLAICFVALVGLVVTLPSVKNLFRRLVHAHAPDARPRTV